jgi:hypothetical protein
MAAIVKAARAGFAAEQVSQQSHAGETRSYKVGDLSPSTVGASSVVRWP